MIWHVITINMQNKIRNIKEKLKIQQSSFWLLFLWLLSTVINYFHTHTHTSIYIRYIYVGIGADHSGLGYHGHSAGSALGVGLGTSVTGGCVQLTKLCKLVILWPHEGTRTKENPFVASTDNAGTLGNGTGSWLMAQFERLELNGWMADGGCGCGYVRIQWNGN